MRIARLPVRKAACATRAVCSGTGSTAWGCRDMMMKFLRTQRDVVPPYAVAGRTGSPSLPRLPLPDLPSSLTRYRRLVGEFLSRSPDALKGRFNENFAESGD